MATKDIEICDKCGWDQVRNDSCARKMFTIGAIWEAGAHSSLNSSYNSYGPRQHSKAINLCHECMKDFKLIVDEALQPPPMEETPAETLMRILADIAAAEIETHERNHHP